MRPKNRNIKSEFVLYDVLYEDGTRTSNRRVPDEELMGQDAEKVVRAALEAQDRKLAEASGVTRGRIKSVTRSKTR